jgi:4-amino-4-deoxy-L-arabinose transferase-like glycosyltransferase
MNVLLALLSAIVLFLNIGLMGTDGLVASLLSFILALGVIAFITQNSEDEDKKFLIQIFVGALLARLALCVFAFGFNFQDYLASDYLPYESRGFELYEYWLGNAAAISETSKWYLFDTQSVGSVMYYLVAGIYLFTGRNPLAASLFCGVIGAATVPLVYHCTYAIYSNRRIAKTTSIAIAFFPAFIVWSSFLLKDGLMMFFLVVTVFCLLRLQKKFNYFDIAAIFVSLVFIAGLRFYIFPVLVLGIFASLIIGTRNTNRSLISRILTTVVLGVILSYFGVASVVQKNVENYGNLNQLQNSRSDLAQTGDSGFGRDIDVSTTEGAISALPIGLTYLLLSPFPWQITSLRSALTLPDTLIWWCSLPLMIIGIFYAAKIKLRQNIAIFVFVLTLTLLYSIFQGNVGTAYRQRTQIQVFLFMFIAVGFEVVREKQENKRLIANARRKGYQIKSIS